MKKTIQCVVALFALWTSHVTAQEWPQKYIYGDAFESVCSPPQWQQMQSAISELAAQRNPKGLTQLLRTYFCDDGLAATRELRKHIAKKVKVTSESTGDTEPSNSWASPRDYVPRNGIAWGASLREEDGSLALSYYPNEVCIAIERLRFVKSRWEIFAAEDACD